MTDILLYAKNFTTLSAQISKLRERYPDKLSFHSIVLEYEIPDLLRYPIIILKRGDQEVHREFVIDEKEIYSKVKELVK